MRQNNVHDIACEAKILYSHKKWSVQKNQNKLTYVTQPRGLKREMVSGHNNIMQVVFHCAKLTIIGSCWSSR